MTSVSELTFKVWKECEECGGMGYYEEMPYSEIGHAGFPTACTMCGGYTGCYVKYRIDVDGQAHEIKGARSVT